MKTLWSIAILLSLIGCATGGHDTEIVQIPDDASSSMATDSIKQLQSLYPPGQTKLNIGQPVPQTDVFGTALVKAMRENGFAVQTVSPTLTAEVSDGLKFQYSVDKPETNLIPNLYRVRLVVGKSILTRAYTGSNKSATPAGAWAVME